MSRGRLLAVAAATTLVLAAGACGGDDDPLGDRAEFREFALYHLGESFEGHRLNEGDAGDGDHVSFDYGDCEPKSDAGCPLPLSIEVYLACARNGESYSGPGSKPTETLRIRGVPAAVYGEGDRLDLHTGDVTVVIHAADVGTMRRAADALRSVDGRVSPGERLPAPSRAPSQAPCA